MLRSPKLQTDRSIQNYKDVLNFVTCQPAGKNCHRQLCIFCPEIAEVAKLLENNFEQHAIDHVECRQWMVNDRCNLKTVTAPAKEFFTKYVDRIPALLRHSFIASQQSDCLKDRKTKLENDEALVICDFSENYAMVIHYAVMQSRHFTGQTHKQQFIHLQYI